MKNNKIFIPSKKDVNDAMIYGETKNREYKQLEQKDKKEFLRVTTELL